MQPWGAEYIGAVGGKASEDDEEGPEMALPGWPLVVIDLKNCPQQSFTTTWTMANETELQTVVTTLTNAVQEAGLQVAPEKIQQSQPWTYLGWRITQQEISPQPLQIKFVIKGRGCLQELDRQDPAIIYIPVNKDNLHWLLAEDAGFQAALADYDSDISIHYPKHSVQKWVTCLVDEGKAVIVVYLDFSKASDTVSHSILLEKLTGHNLDRCTLLG
ncbi:hypothetical protein BTVI_138810 [Pitangus sulphuratus]|nr:hypothetical protein BTVI_138810 [Pitangus sulphuratus]